MFKAWTLADTGIYFQLPLLGKFAESRANNFAAPIAQAPRV